MKIFHNKQDATEWMTTTVDCKWVGLKSQWNITKPDILILRELLEGYIVLEREHGMAKLHIFWNKGQTFDGWVPELSIE